MCPSASGPGQKRKRWPTMSSWPGRNCCRNSRGEISGFQNWRFSRSRSNPWSSRRRRHTAGARIRPRRQMAAHHRPAHAETGCRRAAHYMVAGPRPASPPCDTQHETTSSSDATRASLAMLGRLGVDAAELRSQRGASKYATDCAQLVFLALLDHLGDDDAAAIEDAGDRLRPQRHTTPQATGARAGSSRQGTPHSRSELTTSGGLPMKQLPSSRRAALWQCLPPGVEPRRVQTRATQETGRVADTAEDPSSLNVTRHRTRKGL
jgi:hypothetical protein